MTFDLCILDLCLPDGGGADLCCEIRRIQPHTAVLYYSGIADEVEREEIVAKCHGDYLTKPATMAEINKAILQALTNEDWH